MITEQQMREILAQYAKHGWSLRRVLLSAETGENLSDALFGQAEIFLSEVNALWFSRTSLEGREAWEIRHLSNTPFALVAVFEAEDKETVREQVRQELQTRLVEQASKAGRQNP